MRILIADDNAINRQFLRVIAEQCGARASEALNGEQAIECCQNLAFDLVLLDMRMPGIDGLETASRISAMIRPVPRIVLVSADPRPVDPEILRRCGVSDWLEKPITAAMLGAVLRGPETHLHIHEEPALQPNSIAEPRRSDLVTLLNWQRGMMATGGNESLYRELLRLLLMDIQTLAPQILSCRHAGANSKPGAESGAEKGLEQVDGTQAAEWIHKLKGAARFCAALELEQACTALEQNEDLAADQFKDACTRLTGHLEKVLN